MEDLCSYANRPWAFVGRYLKRRILPHLVILVAVLGAVGFSVSTDYALKGVVDSLSKGPQASHVWTALAVLIGFIAADNMLWRVAALVGAFTFVGVTGDIRRDLFRHMTGHAPSFFADRQPGTLASRITATSNAIFTVENMFTFNVMPPCVAAFLSILYIGTVNLTMAAVLAGIFLAVVLLMFKMASAGKPLHHDFAAKAASVDGEMVDLVGNMNLVRAFSAFKREYKRFDGTIGTEMGARRSSLLYLEKLRITHAFLTVISILGLLYWVIRMWEAGQATNGEVVLVCTLGIRILAATRDLAVALVDATQHTARLSEALHTLLQPHELKDHPEAEKLEHQTGAEMTFDHVAFSYPDGRTVFSDFNLVIPPGQTVGLVGKSGGGKSTLFSLIQRFYEVQGGRILINGRDITRVTQESLREAITVVPQDVSMFHRSLRENIRYGRPDATDEEVWQAAEAAHCTDFIKALPEGFDTIVGDRGVKLSGGQRQRIAIARAILKDSPILLLDEATSALDAESEEAIRAALANLMKGRTVIAIAHRLSTLKDFDRIVVLEGGRIAQDGSPEKLTHLDGFYRELMKKESMSMSLAAA
ncbi:ABC transporter ATP-binding protein [Methylobacterium organophilum]|uniref:Multidrug export ATP-binding/permease protein n=1 Tax=Methylobacterium organophilum TaxID=410 RepID=A0ABQ4TCM3_METOR|nr:ABC transporter ATP-binding protein [Methylobacterium organophilum]UMY15732.1 ABC transporter ATP-binding protein/permease [Methylobacterium organophilum]GJE28239.1 Putative multidrug export ATP-binding/permease protein [Methylobacterium organophilum]